MVRVLNGVHNIESQTIQTCEDPVAVTTAPPERLLIALNHHVIEVRDLSMNPESTFSFPTVDQAFFLTHCITGNYVATLEVKVSREGREVIYTRIYANWDQPGVLDGSQPMRARIAGRVTPSSSQTGGDSLEMIELPVRFPTTTAIACCQATGNLIVASTKTICLFQLVSRLHDISRLRFLDFELWPVTLELSFAPTKLAMVENIVAAMDGESLHVFKINKGVSHRSDQSSTYSGSPLPHSSASGSEKRSGEYSVTSRSPVDLDRLSDQIQLNGYNDTSYVTHLPGIRMNVHDPNRKTDVKSSPFKPPYMVSMGIAIKEMPTNEPWAEQMTTMVESLLQLELEPGNDYTFNNLILRPLYLESSSVVPQQDWSCPRLRSLFYDHLMGLNCLVCTEQEGYLYHFSINNFDTVNLGECVCVISFTSPVRYVCLEAGILHAITMTGLETYTIRSTHAVQFDENQVTPPLEDPVCLMGFRPFIGVIGLLLAEDYLIILAASEMKSVNWTIYSLKLPTAQQLYHEMVTTALGFKKSMPPTYRHLLSEAHMLIKTATHLRASPAHDSTCSTPGSTPSRSVQPHEKELYKQSCALLGQYHILSENEEDWEIGCKYITMSGMPPEQFLKWLEASENQVDLESKAKLGVAYYLTKCLNQWPERLPKSTLATLIEQLEPPHLANLLLKSPVLVSCATDNIRQRLVNRTEPECCLAVELLSEDGGAALRLLPDDDDECNKQLVNLLVKHYQLLFDTMRQGESKEKPTRIRPLLVTFSELAVLLMQEKPHQLAMALAIVVNQNPDEMDVEHVIQVFLTYLPSRIGPVATAATVVLQSFLEEVLIVPGKKPNTMHPPVQDALKILMRSYLSDIRVSSDKGRDPPKIGINKLPEFLNELPSHPTEKNFSTIKLQWLLYQEWLDTKSLSELNQFVYDFLPNCLSLQILAQPQENAIQLLLDHCPSALVTYAKEMIKADNDWTALLNELKTRAEKSNVYNDLFKDVLTYLSENGRLCSILPSEVAGEEAYSEYVLQCQQVRHADHIRCMIMATGEHLLATLNL
ncbi:Hermansky-Pudlak syndrome 3 protein homolog isoform X2 [Nilaparvata lugens]|uniref:Hermansky-Pudlak syndrome 3 protein homolog isoform X2 n=1 Tax=Nilaparvata lugens TaxID=108931 RepID=UPI00193DA734|nr:Hermansky-Pudlak syndrome 3 protein homolog isoform X2 [Nilaparvata lugens]